LALLDAFLVRTRPEPLGAPIAPGARAWVVDLGFGERADTSVELLEALRGAGMGLQVLGVEREAHRVEAAREAHAGRSGLVFRQGGFALPLQPDDDVRLVRVMNVLRGYPLDQAQASLEALGQVLPDGALVCEGSADPEGHLLTCHLLRARSGRLDREALLVCTDFARGFAPLQFRDWLPRDLRRSVRPGHWSHALFSAWTGAFEAARAEGLVDPVERFAASVRGLAAQVQGIDVSEQALRAGQLVWRPEGGVPC